ncbi:MAG: phytanoyl-CoA dioxygenase [Rhodospirillaceae bacterium]|nr:phytanoyl-CoA dioxygenase [Rhodospirillaceae bacterium]MBT6137777.1 phytanoyl-CoA dioxygenase [Rhodospirillaceae bacterium]
MTDFTSATALPNVPWFASPLFESELETSNLDAGTRALAREFAENGIVIVDSGLDNFDEVANDIISACAGKYKKNPMQTSTRIPNAWEFCPSVLTLAGLPTTMNLMETFFQRRPFPFQSINFEHGSRQKEHSDALHFQSIPNDFVAGVWIAMEDVDERNGSLVYYPGSHKVPQLTYDQMGLTAFEQEHHKVFYDRYEALLPAYLEGYGLTEQVTRMRKGQVAIWAANLCHGGGPISEPGSTRYSQVFHYYFDDCSYYTPLTSDPMIGRLSLREPINILTGEKKRNLYNGKPIEVVQPQFGSVA